METSRFLETAAACLANGKRLLYDADWLHHEKHPATSFAVATIAQEEFAKAFLLIFVSRSVVVWNPLIYRATRDHACKQLLGLVMTYISPDSDEYFRRSDEWLIGHMERKKLLEAYKSSPDTAEQNRIWKRIQEISAAEAAIPRPIADAINIFRHEKIGRWESPRGSSTERPAYDEIAKRLGEGQRDREKQDALYVRLDVNGKLLKTPDQVKHEETALALEDAERLGSLVERLLSGNAGNIFEYEKIESAFKLVFANLSETETPTTPES